MTALAERDYFTDLSVLRDPYAFFEEFRGRGPIAPTGDANIFIVTGFPEAVQILNDSDHFSNYMTVVPHQPLPFEPEGDDISEQIAGGRGMNPMLELMVNYDGADHVAARSLMTRLFTPSRLKANADYMSGLADRMIADALADGKCEAVNQLASPFVTLVIADLLGVPDEDREKFRKVIDEGPPAGNMADGEEADEAAALMYMATFFMQYVSERRENPRDDVLTELSTQTYADGTLPDMIEIVKSAMFLFAAGQDTSAKLVGNSLRYLVENKDMQDRLRADPSLIPDFIEEMLRLEGSTKATFRLVRKTTEVAGIELKAGKRLIIALAAANRDDRRWDDPTEFRLGRPKIKEHVAFARGAHTCIGAPLARAEVRILLEKLLAATSDISLSEDHHGKPGESNLEYEPSFIIRGLEALNLTLTAA